MSKNWIIALMLFAFSTVNAQVGESLSDLIEVKGSKYEEGFTQANDEGDSLYYVSYTQDVLNESQEIVEITKAYYFLEKASDATCIEWRLIMPIDEVNAVVRFYNNTYVKLDDMLWKDYETNVLLYLELDDPILIITSYKDK